MAWEHTLNFNGKAFSISSIRGFKDHTLSLSREEIEGLGDDLIDVVNWFMGEGKEWCLVQDWRYADYESYYFTSDEIFSISNSKFASEQDKEACFKYRYSLEKKEPKPREKVPGYVYLIHSETGYYKIGRSKNAQSRIEKLGVKLPFVVKPVCIISCEDMIETERMLHDKFQDKRVNGEWFLLSAEDVEYIKSI